MPQLYVTKKRIPNLYSYILALMPSYTEYNFKHRCLVIQKVDFSSILFYKVFHVILIFCVLISPFSYTNHNVSKTFIVMPKKFLIHSEFFIGFYGAVLSLIFFNTRSAKNANTRMINNPSVVPRTHICVWRFENPKNLYLNVHL